MLPRVCAVFDNVLGSAEVAGGVAVLRGGEGTAGNLPCGIDHSLEPLSVCLRAVGVQYVSLLSTEERKFFCSLSPTLFLLSTYKFDEV